MVIFKKPEDISSYLANRGVDNRETAFIPTMGALHQGHISLVMQAKSRGTFTVCSIFVNPTQFNDISDLQQYPVTTDADIEMLLEAGCDVLFLPGVDDIYPGGEATVKTYDFGYLDTILEGAKRAGHFRGVGQVVARLLEIVQPRYLYMGQKDYQQCMVVKKLLELTGMNGIELVTGATMREQDGLAMSSRNRRLNASQRTAAPVIYQCLVSIESKQRTAAFAIVRKECEELLADKGFVTEYVALANADTLELMDDYDNDKPMVALIATKTVDVRLIDNMVLAG